MLATLLSMEACSSAVAALSGRPSLSPPNDIVCSLFVSCAHSTGYVGTLFWLRAFDSKRSSYISSWSSAVYISVDWADFSDHRYRRYGYVGGLRLVHPWQPDALSICELISRLRERKIGDT